MPMYPNTGLPENVETICETIPNPGIINIYTSLLLIIINLNY